MDVTAPSRSPRRHCSPACRRRAFPPFPAYDGSSSNSGMQSGSHASNNLAKLPFLFETTIPRARLRPKYGQGFGQASGRVKSQIATPGQKGGCDDGSHRDPEPSDGQSGASI